MIIRKTLKHLYQPSSKEVQIVDVPPMNFIMIDGEGDPNTAKDYQDALESLFAVSYAIKFMIKRGSTQIDYGVLPLEGLWWSDNMSDFTSGNKDKWKWTSMIMQPEYVTVEIFKEAIEQVRKKKNPVAIQKLRFEKYDEGKAAQIMHIGQFSEEGPTIEKIHNFIRDNGCKLIKKHHEIYLSDIRKTASEKLKTVIRQPIKRIA